jgi:hypothetical protein
MNEVLAALPGNGRSASQRAEARAESHLFILDKIHAQKRKGKLAESLTNSWPIAVGMLLAVCAPFLSEILSLVKPWGMWLVFPFVELMARPELHLGGQFREIAPQAMLFLQFPLEGLAAKKFLRGRVTLAGVLGQVLLYHFLGAVQLFLVWRALGDGGMLR